MVAAAAGGGLTVNSYTVERLLAEYIEHAKSVGRAATTTSKYEQLAKNVLNPVIGTTKLTKLTARHLDTLYGSLTARGNSPASVRRVHALIAVALRQGLKWGLLDRNVATLASPPSVRALEPRVLTREEVASIIERAETILMDETDPPERQADALRVSELAADAFVLAALTGARRGELVGLRWDDWDRGAGTLRISRSVYEVVGGGWAVKDVKNHSSRTVSLDTRAVQALNRRWQASADLAESLGRYLSDEGYVLSPWPGGLTPIMPGRLTRMFADSAEAAGLHAHLHLLRHWAATELVAQGVPITVVAKRLGHRDSSVTLRVYAHALPQQDAYAAQMLGEALTASQALSRGS